MSIYLNEVLDYLDTHPVCRQADSVESVMALLQDAYALHCEMPVRECFPGLPEKLYTFCEEQEKQSFSQGVVVGMLLMTEVNSALR